MAIKSLNSVLGYSVGEVPIPVISDTGNISAANVTVTGNLIVSGTTLSSFAGNISMTSRNIINVADPITAQDVATKSYTDLKSIAINTTRVALNALGLVNNIVIRQVYLITDENRIAIGLTVSTYETYAKQSEIGGGGGVSSWNGVGTGNGSTVVLVMTSSPLANSDLMVTENGLRREFDTYTISGTNLSILDTRSGSTIIAQLIVGITGPVGPAASAPQIKTITIPRALYSAKIDVAVANALTTDIVIIDHVPENDEAEFDALLCSGHVLNNGIVTVYVHAVPGPISGDRKIAIQLK